MLIGQFATTGGCRLPPGVAEVEKLLRAEESADSLERNWSWRATPAEGGLQIEATVARRQQGPNGCYNDHPVSLGYFGSYCMDGLAMAFHCVHSTTSFDNVIERCINFLGDADSTASIAGQLAGAIYELGEIKREFV